MSASPADPSPAASSTSTTTASSSSYNWFPSWPSSSSSSTTSAATTVTPNNASSSSNTPTTTPQSSSSSSSSSWFSISPWTDSFHYAAEATYSTLSDAVSSVYSSPQQQANMPGGVGGMNRSSSGASWGSQDSPEYYAGGYGSNATSESSWIVSLQRQQRKTQRRRQRRLARQQQQHTGAHHHHPHSSSSSLDLAASTMFQNPYQSVRGRNASTGVSSRRQSMKAIRSFIQLVPTQVNDDNDNDDESEEGNDHGMPLYQQHPHPHQQRRQTSATDHDEILAMPSLHVPLETVPEQQQKGLEPRDSDDEDQQRQPNKEPLLQDSGEYGTASGEDWSMAQRWRISGTMGDVQPRPDMTAETAAHLAEGTVRAWRDLCLDEAVELNAALRFWSDRWEQPALSLLEAGPNALLLGQYRHRHVGQRVAQIQAVLARRCAAIGELQQHLLQAGWQKGVAQWGVLGQGANWATVAGFDGSLPTTTTTQQQEHHHHQAPPQPPPEAEEAEAPQMAAPTTTTAVGATNKTMVQEEEEEGNMAKSDPLQQQEDEEYAEPRPISSRLSSSQQSNASSLLEEDNEPMSPTKEPTVPNLQNLPSASPLTRQLSDQAVRFSSVMAAEDMPPLPPQAVTRMTSSSSVATAVSSTRSLGLLPTTTPTSSTKGPSPPTDHSNRLADDIRASDSKVGGLSGEPHQTRRASVADVFVRKRDGGGTFVDDPAFLARWSVQAIALVRRQLFRASNGTVPLPYASHWSHNSTEQQPPATQNEETEVDDEDDEEDNLILGPAKQPRSLLPMWAMDVGQYWATESSQNPEEDPAPSQVMITDLSALTDEVSELLYCMEDIMDIQRQRRLDRLHPPSWWRRNWYLLACGVPFSIWLIRHGRLRYLIRYLAKTVKVFFVERIQTPVMAIFDEVWKGRRSFSDKKARKEAIAVLKKMIRSWLDDAYPKMPAEERQRMADAMDVSLVETKKEQSMRTLGFNTFDVVRMSFIEMQWLKKEMMNALDAMDEVMSANDINMNLAAVTPVFLIIYFQTRILRYLFYALLRIGRSREEVYASFRAILLDIERLLVMRDDPPDARATNTAVSSSSSPSVLGPDDLGMLMLLIHECRTILWKERRRFSPSMARSVSEDLAELAGERGAVSVKQQLQIVARMTRSYPFLKVISTGHFFGQNQLRRE